MIKLAEPTVSNPPSFPVLGIRFHTLLMVDAVALCERLIAERRPTQISFANAQTIAMCWRDKTLRDVMNQSDLTFPDGMSIVWGGRMLGYPIRQRVAGPDVMAELCARSVSKGYRLFLLGTSMENLEALRATLRRQHPGIDIAGMYSPPMAERFTPDETEKMIATINAASADLLFVGLSFPKQERWIHENAARLNPPLRLGVGAAFDFLSGRVPRAPAWLQTRGLEWLFRLWCEPRRLWRRYLWGNGLFISLLMLERLKKRTAR